MIFVRIRFSKVVLPAPRNPVDDSDRNGGVLEGELILNKESGRGFGRIPSLASGGLPALFSYNGRRRLGALWMSAGGTVRKRLVFRRSSRRSSSKLADALILGHIDSEGRGRFLAFRGGRFSLALLFKFHAATRRRWKGLVVFACVARTSRDEPLVNETHAGCQPWSARKFPRPVRCDPQHLKKPTSARDAFFSSPPASTISWGEICAEFAHSFSVLPPRGHRWNYQSFS